MIKLINYINQAFLLPVTTEVIEKISGESELKFEFVEDEYNKTLIDNISKKWKVTNVNGSEDNKEFVITFIKKESNSKSVKVSVVAKEKQIDDLKSRIIYENLTGNYTAKKFFEIVFADSLYNFVLKDKVYSKKWENAGDGENKLETFKKGLERYGLEFEYKPKIKTFVLKKKVFHLANYYIKNGTNALNFKLEEDSSDLYTYIKGFGNYNNKFQNAGLKLEYKHPLIDTIGKYEAPPVKDGKINDSKYLMSKMKEIVNNSFKYSLSLDFIALQDEFPEAVVHVGDIVPVKDSPLLINDNIRIIEVKTKRDENNNIFKQEATLGDYKRSERYLSLVNNSVTYTKDLANKNINFEANQNKVNSLISDTENLISMGNALNANSNGLTLINKLNIIALTKSKGIQISNNGGDSFKALINDGLLNTELIPLATSTSDGIMTKEDKLLINQFHNQNVNKMIMTNINKILNKDDSILLSKSVSDTRNGLILDWKDTENNINFYQIIPQEALLPKDEVLLSFQFNNYISKRIHLNNHFITGNEINVLNEANKIILESIFEY